MNFLKRFRNLLTTVFTKPKLRVRKIDLDTNLEVWGTVEKTTHGYYYGMSRTYWSIVWDDAPGVWVTVPTSSFIWYKGHHTKIEREYKL